MGIYSEYLNRGLGFQELTAERKIQLQRIAKLRNRDVLVYACDASKGATAPIALSYDDLLPITDQLENLHGKHLDVILETVGGSGEVAEDIITILRQKFETVSFIVPGMAKSAGTIMVMGGDEILMEAASSLGPIDAQIQADGKVFSAEAFLKGLESIKAEVDKANTLNRAYHTHSPEDFSGRDPACRKRAEVCARPRRRMAGKVQIQRLDTSQRRSSRNGRRPKSAGG